MATAPPEKKWYDHSLIPPAYHVRPPGAASVAAANERAVRLGELSAGFGARFAPLSPAEEAALSPSQREARRDLALALELACAPSTLVAHPSPPPASASGHGASVLAYAAASVPLGSSADPQPLGSQLLFPAARPSGRQQVSYLYFALEAMLREVGRDAEQMRRAAAKSVALAKQGKGSVKQLIKDATAELRSDSTLEVPPLMSDLQTYAAWCGLTPPVSAPSTATSLIAQAAPTAGSAPALPVPPASVNPVADLALGAFTHTPAPASSKAVAGLIGSPSASNSASASSSSALVLSGTASAVATPASPGGSSPSSMLQEIDARFQADVQTLQRFAEWAPLAPKSHTKLATIMQEISVYLVGLHELSRQEWVQCQERGDLMHLLVQRCATLVQSLLPTAQKEAAASVAALKASIHASIKQREKHFDTERIEWQRLNTHTSATLIAMRDELKAQNARVKQLEAEVERRRIECTETDRLQRANMELEKQLQSLREQVQSALAWRADQQATLEALHFDVKKAHEEKQQLQQQLSDIKQRMKEEEEKHQQHLLQLQTKFIELRVPDSLDPAVKQEVTQLLESGSTRGSGTAENGAGDARNRTPTHSAQHQLPSSQQRTPTHSNSSAMRQRTPSPASGNGSHSRKHSRSLSFDLQHVHRTPSLIYEGDSDETNPSDDEASEAPSSHRSSASSAPLHSPLPPAVADSSRSHGSEAAAVLHASMEQRAAEIDETHHTRRSDGEDSAMSGGVSGRSSHLGLSHSVGEGDLPPPPASLVAAFSALHRNTRLEFASHEVDLYLLCHPARIYHLIVTRKQRAKFYAMGQLTTAEKRKNQFKLPGTIGPKSGHRSAQRDWLVNFCWSVLKRRAETDAVADCYQQPRQPFPEFFYQTLLMHETVKGVKSVFTSVIWSALRSLIKYKNTSHIASVLVDMLEERIPLECVNFLLALMGGLSHTGVGLDYGAGKYGQIRWLCTLRTRHITQLALRDYPPEAVKAMNHEVESLSEGMSLAEMKQYQSTRVQMRTDAIEASGDSKSGGGAAGKYETLQMAHLKQLTKIDYGLFLKIAAKHFNVHARQQAANVKAHFRNLADKTPRKSLSLTQFTSFVRHLSPSVDSCHIEQLFTDAVQHARGDGVRFDDFKAAGGLQLLTQDYAKLIYHSADWAPLHGAAELLACINEAWHRLRPAIQPFLQLAQTDRSLLSKVLSERVGRMEREIDHLRASLLHAPHAARLRELIRAFRECVYEIYGFLRYREESGAIVRVETQTQGFASNPGVSPPPSHLAPAPGPNLAHLNDEINALLFMLQRELLSFCAHDPVPSEEMIHDHDAN